MRYYYIFYRNWVRINGFLTLLILLALNLNGQSYVEVSGNIWGGGLSGYAKPVFEDFDNDGLLDMLVGVYEGNLVHYEQIETLSNDFMRIDENFGNINHIWAAPTITNLNNNGLIDLLIGQDDGSLSYYEQTAANSSDFVLITNDFNNIDVDFHSVPTFTDFNSDGLLDLLIGDFYGDIHYYQQDASGSTAFSMVSSTFIETGYNYLTPVVTDIDNDGLFDLILGNSSSQLLHYEQATLNSSTFNLISSNFSSLAVGSSPFPVFVDVDNDGLLNLVVGDYDGQVIAYEQDGINSENFIDDFSFNMDLGFRTTPTIIDLDNDGLLDLVVGAESKLAHFEQPDPGSTDFALITNDMIGTVGAYPAPSFCDLNNDGLLEMIVGVNSSTHLYQQTSAGSSSFNLINSNFYGTYSDNGLKPCVTDIDNDGLYDLLLGNSSGLIVNFEQIAINSFEFISNGYLSIDVGSESAPSVYDIDNDGLLDLIIGESNGNLNRYEQTALNALTFDLITENLYSIVTNNKSTPSIYDINNNGEFEIIVGENNGGLHLYAKELIIANDTMPVNLESSLSNYYDLLLNWEYGSNLKYGDDIESYNPGDLMAVENPTWWTTWSNQPGGPEDIIVSDEQAKSGMNSLIVDGTTDAVLKLGDKTFGNYQFSFNMYVPAENCGFYNIQKYESPGTEFGQQVYFYRDGTGSIDLEYGDVASFHYPKDTWFEVVQIIDLDNDWTRLYIDGYLIREWPFRYSNNNTGGTLQLGGCNFYPGASNGDIPKYFVDDIDFREVISSKAGSKDLLGYNVYKNGINTGLVSINNYNETNLPIGSYEYYTTTLFDYGESEPSYTIKVDIKGPPQAEFNAGITHISDGGHIHFTDLTSGTFNFWEWDFTEDGITDSYDQNPSWEYPLAGTYSVSLTVSDGVTNSTETKTDFITVQSEPLLLNVPADIGSIQWAIDASYDGDTVIVHPGTYYENVRCENKDLVLASMMVLTEDTNYISQTVINGGGKDLVMMLSGFNNGSVFQGFTITNGSNSLGGGLYINSCTDAEISHLTISGNQTTGNGGGLYVSGTYSTISDIVVSGNTANVGGGIYISGGTPIFKEIVVENNTATAGGGIYISSSTNAIIENSIVNANYASINGGGMYVYNCTPRLVNNLISNNWSDDPSSGAGGIRCYNYASPTLLNNTIVNNAGAYGGGLRVNGNSNPVLINSILWGNTATESGDQVRLDDDTSDPDFMNCNIEGGTGGFGYETGTLFTGQYIDCLDSDPLFIDFVNNDYQITENSPCINVGKPDTTGMNLPEFDLIGNIRIQGGTIDMGCYEFNYSDDLLILNINSYLEGPFNSTEMFPFLNFFGLIPLSQPYNNSPWNYSGTESVLTIPNSNVIDWILIEIRDAANVGSAGHETTVSKQAAFILKDGTIVGLDGSSPLQYYTMISQQIFVVIYHRNHLPIMSANPLTESGGIYSYDFSDSSGKAFGGEKSQKEIATGVWGMIASDADANGQINNIDKNDHWLLQVGSSGYLESDFDMSGSVNSFDKYKWEPNSGKGSQVPE